jgi:hypothetical protein
MKNSAMIPMAFGPNSPNNGMVFSVEGDTVTVYLVPPGTTLNDCVTPLGECNVLHAVTVANDIIKAVNPHLTEPPCTRDRLEMAIAEVLGADVNEALRANNREDTRILRSALNMLEQEGPMHGRCREPAMTKKNKTENDKEKVQRLAAILVEKAAGKRNELGDPWGDWVCSEAAELLLGLMKQRDSLRRDNDHAAKSFNVEYSSLLKQRDILFEQVDLLRCALMALYDRDTPDNRAEARNALTRTRQK